LKEHETRALEIASLLGGTFSLPLLHAACGSEAGVDALFGKGILTKGRTSNHARFVEAAMPGRVAERISWGQRRQHFAALGQAAVDLRLPSHEIAAFFDAAQQSVTARDWWAKAAGKACVAGDYALALNWVDRALALWPWNESPEDRVHLLREKARCATNSGNAVPAAAAWDELADYAADSGQPALQVEALQQLAGLGTDAVRISECLKRAAQVAERELAPAQAVRSILGYVDNLASRVRVKLARGELERAVRIAENSREAALISEVRGWQGLLAAMSGEHTVADRFVEESLRIAVEHELAEQAAIAYRRRANIQDYGGRYPEVKESHTAAIAFCRKSKSGGELVCMGCLAYACFRTGDWPDAIKSARTVTRNADEVPTLKAIGACVLGLVHAFRGERAPAVRQLGMALNRFRIDGFAGMEFFALWGQAYLRYSDGDLAGAVEMCDQIRALWRETDDVHDVVPAVLFAGAIYADGGHFERLADCLDVLGQIILRNPLGEAKAALAALQAEQARCDQRSADCADLFSQAAEAYAALTLPVERLWVECRRVKPASGQTPKPADARIIELARRLGVRPMLASLQTSSATEAGDLTPRQQEVLRLLAQGLTSKEIADRVGLSTRTVEMHVSRLLQRLNCRTRPEAIRQAMERGWLRQTSP